MLAEMKRSNCKLEQVARQPVKCRTSCISRRRLTGCLLKLLAYQIEVTRAEKLGFAQVLDCKYGFGRCLDLSDCHGGPPPCKHVPCPDGQDLERGKGEAKPGRVPPRRLKYASYEPVRRGRDAPFFGSLPRLGGGPMMVASFRKPSPLAGFETATLGAS